MLGLVICCLTVMFLIVFEIHTKTPDVDKNIQPLNYKLNINLNCKKKNSKLRKLLINSNNKFQVIYSVHGDKNESQAFGVNDQQV